jgi:trigger factor
LLESKEKKENACYHMTFSVPAEVVDQAIEKSTKTIQKKVKVPGFRKGKVPPHMVKSRYYNDVLNDAAREIVASETETVCKAEGIAPYDAPRLEKIDIREGEPFQFEYDLDVFPSVELATLKNIKVVQDTAEVKENDIKKELDHIRTRFAEVKVKDDDAVSGEGDILIGDILCFNGEEPLAELDRKGVRVLAEKRDDTEIDLVKLYSGHKKGDVIDVTKIYHDVLPQQYNRDTFRASFTVNSIEERILPEMDDDLAKEAGFDSLAALKEHIREFLQNYADRSLNNRVESNILQELCTQSTFDVPVSLQNSALDSEKNRYIEQHNINEEHANQYFNEHPESIEECRKRSRQTIETILSLQQVAQDADITVEDEELKKFIADDLRSKQQDASDDRVIQILKDTDKRENYVHMLTNKKAMDYIKENITIKKGKSLKIDQVLSEGRS